MLWSVVSFPPKGQFEISLIFLSKSTNFSWSCGPISFFSDQQKMVSVMLPKTHQSILMAVILSGKLVQENYQISLGKLSFLLEEWIIYDKYWMIGWKKLLFVNCISASSSFTLHNYSSQFFSRLIYIYICSYNLLCCSTDLGRHAIRNYSRYYCYSDNRRINYNS